MKVSETLINAPASVEILDECRPQDIDEILEFFHSHSLLFNIYRKDSEISKINRGILRPNDVVPVVRKVLKACDETRVTTNGYFDCKIERMINPAGLLKGYLISEAASHLRKKGYRNFYIEIGGDMEVCGSKNGKMWKIGIANPSSRTKPYAIHLQDKGLATSISNGHGIPIYNPVTHKVANAIKSVTVIADTCFDADRFSTALLAMGEKAMAFLEHHEELAAFIVFRDGKEYFTPSIDTYM